ncbi:LysM peptidoglycan-binding domain-containing protein [Limosilactobacillus sp.]|jgi:LysM repeat protein|uniref:aggregation-promoting factor n=1 Tax=Limosilactobacillus sp. TaxID=2773925 RepID=UPI0025C11256|nr:LysM peptidoglycan-binding domain-containing protein [Limosilactobacillus sp.]MCH3922227.1 LysM peptidoglycan-binding domain-containing protein [Limosilactobacillus sp.]MCH3928999.1 LysM peptidoglycan-binding domain-containing protein [Limosilactobacillus sp.]
MISKKNFMKAATTLGAMTLGVAAATSVANADSVYTVKSGDTLSSISYKFAQDNSLVNSIAKDNHISNINQISVGQRLVIKSGSHQGGQSTSAPAATTTTTSTTTTNNNASSTVSGSEAAAKAWIANRESGGSYSAMNGQYVGKYQLSASYLGGDYSAANQEKVADQYVASRYGSWTAAQQFWQANGWY